MSKGGYFFFLVCSIIGSYRSRIQSRPTNIVPSLNNHVEAAPTVPVTPSTPVATVPASRMTQAFMPPPASSAKTHEVNAQQTFVMNNTQQQQGIVASETTCGKRPSEQKHGYVEH